MFNPIKVVLPSAQQNEPLLEALDVAYDSIRSRFFDVIKSSQEDWIANQKQLFHRLRNEYDDVDDYGYSIITTKYHSFSDSIFDFLQDTSISVKRLFYKHTTISDQQIRIIKSALNHEPVLGQRLYSNDGIGFVTIPLPSIKELVRAFSAFNQAWNNMEPLQLKEEVKKLPKWFTSEGSIHDKMDEELEVCFEKGKEYSIKEYVDCYDAFKKDLRKALSDTKQRVEEVKERIGEVYAQNATNYKAYVKRLKGLNLTKEERDSLIAVALHNYSVFSDLNMAIVNGCASYSAHLYSLAFRSCANFKNVIQTIYGGLYDEKEEKKHAVLPGL